MAKVAPAALERQLAEIAREIRADYAARGKPLYFAAVPYVNAMERLTTESLAGTYGYDTTEEVVIRLLGNLGSWRGEVATRVKTELKAAVNDYAVGRGKRPVY